MNKVKLFSKKYISLLTLITTLTILKAYGADPYTGNFTSIIATVSTAMMLAGIVIGVAVIVKGGYGLMTSEGDPGKVKEAKEDLTASITGVLFMLLGATLMKIIFDVLFGVDITA